MFNSFIKRVCTTSILVLLSTFLLLFRYEPNREWFIPQIEHG